MNITTATGAKWIRPRIATLQPEFGDTVPICAMDQQNWHQNLMSSDTENMKYHEIMKEKASVPSPILG